MQLTSESVESPSPPGHPPVANAGDDMTVKEKEKITLDASALILTEIN